MRTDDGTTERQKKSKIFQFSQFFFFPLRGMLGLDNVILVHGPSHILKILSQSELDGNHFVFRRLWKENKQTNNLMPYL